MSSLVFNLFTLASGPFMKFNFDFYVLSLLFMSRSRKSEEAEEDPEYSPSKTFKRQKSLRSNKSHQYLEFSARGCRLFWLFVASWCKCTADILRHHMDGTEKKSDNKSQEPELTMDQLLRVWKRGKRKIRREMRLDLIIRKLRVLTQRMDEKDLKHIY